MTDTDRLHRACLENPDEDTPRLVYADALQETGRPAAVARAELIRVQVEAAGLGAKADHGECECAECRRYDSLRRRAESLLKKWGAKWLPASGRKAAALSCAITRGGDIEAGLLNAGLYRFARGFVSEFRLTIADLGLSRGLDGRRCGELVREALSAHPLERAVFAWEGHEPEVRVRFVHTGYDWMALAEAGDVIRDGEVLARQWSHLGRAAMLRHAPDLLGRFFGEIAFAETPQPIPI